MEDWHKKLESIYGEIAGEKFEKQINLKILEVYSEKFLEDFSEKFPEQSLEKMLEESQDEKDGSGWNVEKSFREMSG